MSDERQTTSYQTITPGEILRAAREDLGYNEVYVAERLCLSTRVIADIENNEYSRFVAEIYLIGHIRSYARLVQIDEHQILQAYRAMGVTIERDPQLSLSQPQAISRYSYPRFKHKSLLWVGIVVVLVLMLLVMMWWREQRPRFSTAQPEESSTLVAAAGTGNKRRHFNQNKNIVALSSTQTGKRKPAAFHIQTTSAKKLVHQSTKINSVITVPKSGSSSSSTKYQQKAEQKKIREPSSSSKTTIFQLAKFVPDYHISPVKE